MFKRIRAWLKKYFLKLTSPAPKQGKSHSKKEGGESKPTMRAILYNLVFGVKDTSKIYPRNYCINCGRDHYRKNTLSCSAKCYRELRAKQKARRAA